MVDAEIALLTSRDILVTPFSRHNDQVNTVSRRQLAADTIWSTTVGLEFESAIRRTEPDVIHIHNTFPLISPSIYWVASRLRLPVVQTLHNFRLLCPQAMFLRQGLVCEDCLGKVPWRGAIRGCYRDSVIQSTVLTSMLTLHRAIGTWQNKITRYIALNEFCRNKFIEGGLPAERIVIKPNFVDFAAPVSAVRHGFLFVGRLSAEKGIDVLSRAASAASGISIRVAGTGPQADLLTQAPEISLLGALSTDAVRAEMSQAMALVLPSIWYENFPRTLVEAFACGLPVIASRIGALAELVEDGINGLLFDTGNAQDLAEKMNWAQQHPTEMAQMGRNARAHYEAEFTAERNYQQLMAIYEDAIAEVKSGN